MLILLAQINIFAFYIRAALNWAHARHIILCRALHYAQHNEIGVNERLLFVFDRSVPLAPLVQSCLLSAPIFYASVLDFYVFGDAS